MADVDDLEGEGWTNDTRAVDVHAAEHQALANLLSGTQDADDPGGPADEVVFRSVRNLTYDGDPEYVETYTLEVWRSGKITHRYEESDADPGTYSLSTFWPNGNWRGWLREEYEGDAVVSQATFQPASGWGTDDLVGGTGSFIGIDNSGLQLRHTAAGGANYTNIHGGGVFTSINNPGSVLAIGFATNPGGFPVGIDGTDEVDDATDAASVILRLNELLAVARKLGVVATPAP